MSERSHPGQHELKKIETSPTVHGLLAEHSAARPEQPAESSDRHTERQVTALRQAETDVHEALDGQELSTILEGIDYSDTNYTFVAMDSYHGEAVTGEFNTRIEGKGNSQYGGDIASPQYYESRPGAENKWGRPREEAHYSGQPVEKVGIRKSADTVWATTEEMLPIPGWKGKLGFKRMQRVSRSMQVDPKYTFDYEFAAPSYSEDDSALDVGNRTGQNIRLSLNLSKEQAEALSGVLQRDPKAARQVLDAFVRNTGDVGKWNAEIFDQDGKFHDPGERYGDGLRARDVRPRYEAVPRLEPEIVGLVGGNEVIEKPASRQHGLAGKAA